MSKPEQIPEAETSAAEWPWVSKDIDIPNSIEKWPKVSIIMPSLNQVDYIEQAIRSVLLQNYPNLEFIIIDGGSGDGSIEIIEKYSLWIDHWLSEPDNGQSAALNRGFRLASGDILAWLNSDDLYLPGCIFKMAERMTNQPDTGLVIGQVGVIDAKNRRIGSFEPVDYSLQKLLSFKQIFPQQAAFFRRWVVDRIGLLREDLHYAMDHEYFVRIAMNHIPITFIRDEMALFRISGRNKGSAYRSKWAYEFEVIANSILDSQKQNDEINEISGSILGGAYYRGSDAFYQDECYSIAREWLIKAKNANSSYLFQPGWWKRILLSYSGKWGNNIVFRIKKYFASRNANRYTYDWNFNKQIIEENNLDHNTGLNHE